VSKFKRRLRSPFFMKKLEGDVMKTINNGAVIVLLSACRVGGEHAKEGAKLTVGKDLSKQDALYMINGKRAKPTKDAAAEAEKDND